MKCWSWVIVVFGLCVAAIAAQEDAVRRDLNRLEGVWQLVSRGEAGKPLTEDELESRKMTFKGNKVSHPGVDGKMEEGPFTLDPSKRPAAIELPVLAGPDKGRTRPGIYSIETDTLTLCFASKVGGDRPTQFKEDKDVTLLVLEREKPRF